MNQPFKRVEKIANLNQQETHRVRIYLDAQEQLKRAKKS